MVAEEFDCNQVIWWWPILSRCVDQSVERVLPEDFGPLGNIGCHQFASTNIGWLNIDAHGLKIQGEGQGGFCQI